MEQYLLEQLNKWHEEDCFQEIIEKLEDYPNHDYETIGHLARAYNNRGLEDDYEKAIELLTMVEDFGRDDPLWHYRLGYAQFYSGRYIDAVQAFERAAELDPADEDTLTFLELCTENLLSEMGEYDEDYEQELYTEEELNIVEDYIADVFGDYESVFHELVSPDIHVDICLIPPDGERDFYTLVTMGMGAHLMNIPEEISEYNLDRAELVVCLPADWDLHSNEEKWYWPIRMLKILSRLPLQEDTWLGWGHTIDSGEAFDESTEMCGSMLITPANFGEETFVCPLPDDSEVNFYQVIPLYREEMDYKMEHGADELLEQLDSSVLIVNPKRGKFASDKLLS